MKHLFLVASSLDSMVLGEAQIVNQIKEAYQKAAEQDTVGPISHQLFQSAMSVAGKVRTDTKLSEGRISIASVAVGEFGKGIFERFDNKVVLILGAGEMAEETLRYLVDEGVREILIANRSFDRGSQLAEKWGGKPILFDFWKDYLSSVDVIVSTTGANEPIVTASQFSELRKIPKLSVLCSFSIWELHEILIPRLPGLMTISFCTISTIWSKPAPKTGLPASGKLTKPLS